MKLSEAIEQGWTGIDQITGEFHHLYWSEEDEREVVGAACAIGAACLTRSRDYIDDMDVATGFFPELLDIVDPEKIEYGTRVKDRYADLDDKIRLKDAILYYNDDAQLGKKRIIELVASMGY
jgi:hypothetical protein